MRIQIWRCKVLFFSSFFLDGSSRHTFPNKSNLNKHSIKNQRYNFSRNKRKTSWQNGKIINKVGAGGWYMTLKAIYELLKFIYDFKSLLVNISAQPSITMLTFHVVRCILIHLRTRGRWGGIASHISHQLHLASVQYFHGGSSSITFFFFFVLSGWKKPRWGQHFSVGRLS